MERDRLLHLIREALDREAATSMDEKIRAAS